MVQLVALLGGFLIGISGSLICAGLYLLIKSAPIHLDLKKLGNLPNIPLIWLFLPLYLFDIIKNNAAYLHSPYFYYGEIWSTVGGAVGLTMPFLLFSFGIIRLLRQSEKNSRGSKNESWEKPNTDSLESLVPDSSTSNESNKMLKIIIPLIFGVAGWGYGAFKAYDNFTFYSKALSANAEIVMADKISGRGGHWNLDVHFLTETNEQVNARVVSHQNRGVSGYQHGDKITVFYLPSNTKDARFKEWEDIYLTPIFFFAMGLFGILSGLKRAGANVKRA